MARPKHSTKERLPIYKNEFETLILKIKKSSKIHRSTKKKLIRAYTLLFYTGCRMDEIREFNIKDIEFIIEHMVTSLNNKNKTKKTRLLKFNQVGLAAIKELDLSDCKDKLFYKNNSEEAMTSTSFNRLLNKYLAKFLNDLYTTHSFRAGMINSTFKASGGNIKVSQKLAGHTDPKTTFRYIVASEEQIEEALNKAFI